MELAMGNAKSLSHHLILCVEISDSMLWGWQISPNIQWIGNDNWITYPEVSSLVGSYDITRWWSLEIIR